MSNTTLDEILKAISRPQNEEIRLNTKINIDRIEGGTLQIPKTMPYEDVIQECQRRMQAEEETINIYETFPVLPYDGAWIAKQVMADKYAWVNGEPNHGFLALLLHS